MNFRTTAIVNLAAVRSGGGAPQDPSAFSDQGHPFVRAGSLSGLLDGRDECHLEKIAPDVARAHRLQLFPKGTVLFAKSGISATKGYIYSLRHPAYVVNHLAALVPHDSRDSAFLTRALERFPPSSLIKDQAYPSIRLGDIEQMEILAPTSIQDRLRIATILDKADALRRKRKHAIELLSTLSQATFVDMFGRPGDRKSVIKQRPLGELAELINGDRSSNYPSGADIVASGILFLSTTNITPDGLDLTSANYITKEKFASLSRGKLRPGDVIITLRGSLGQTALFENAGDTGFINAQMMIIRTKEVLDARYLLQALQLEDMLAHFKRLASGSAVPQLTAKQMSEIEIPVPTMSAQREFGSRRNAIQKARKIAVVQSLGLDNLFASLQSCAFSGQLS